MLWLANLSILIGMWMLGYKWRHSFLFSIFGEALYTYWSFAQGFVELGSICLVFCLVAFRNWWKWRPEIVKTPNDLMKRLLEERAEPWEDE